MKVDARHEKVTIVNGEIVRKPRPQREAAISTIFAMPKSNEYINHQTYLLATGLFAGRITTLKEVKELVNQGARCDVRHLKRIFWTVGSRPVKEYREIALYFTQELKIKPTEEIFFDFLQARFDPKDLDLLPFEGVVFSEEMLKNVALFGYSKEVFELFLRHGAPFNEKVKNYGRTEPMRQWIEDRYHQLHPIPKKTFKQKVWNIIQSVLKCLKKLVCWRK